MSFNKVQLQGRLERHPEVKMARDFKMIIIYLQVKNDKDVTETFEITTWGNTAEWVEKNCEKGSIVSVEGKLGISSWGEGENKKTKIKITGNKVSFCKCHIPQEAPKAVAPAAPIKPMPKPAGEISNDFDELPF